MAGWTRGFPACARPIGMQMRPISDQSQEFTVTLALIWGVVVALPLLLSAVLGQPLAGLPLLGVVAWMGILRVARWLSPAAHADALARRGRFAEALAMCDAALAIEGSNAWAGTRRLAWLNRRTTALLALGRIDEALVAALNALSACADPETVSNSAQALLLLNRYDEAADAGRLALALTRERSVNSHAVLAMVCLARGMPAEAEALAQAGRIDARSLLPLVRPEHYALCLAALSRALRVQGKWKLATHVANDLRDACKGRQALRAIALVEDADRLPNTEDNRLNAFARLAAALEYSPSYVLWYVTQPCTLTALRGDARFATMEMKAAERAEKLAQRTPPLEDVMRALAAARADASPRPARQSSWRALVMQIATLSGTLALLVWWAWRFFLAGS
ncbi:MAG: tetratricopeptide repeat protein [Ktedonobacterales bacterium]